MGLKNRHTFLTTRLDLNHSTNAPWAVSIALLSIMSAQWNLLCVTYMVALLAWGATVGPHRLVMRAAIVALNRLCSCDRRLPASPLESGSMGLGLKWRHLAAVGG